MAAVPLRTAAETLQHAADALLQDGAAPQAPAEAALRCVEEELERVVAAITDKTA